jgi:hypothetical protein
MFVDKVRDIVGLYLNPPLMGMVLCVDEKSQIQENQCCRRAALLTLPDHVLRGSQEFSATQVISG